MRVFIWEWNLYFGLSVHLGQASPFQLVNEMRDLYEWPKTLENSKKIYRSVIKYKSTFFSTQMWTDFQA